MPSSRIKLRFSARYLAPAAVLLVMAGATSCSTVWDDLSALIEDDEANDRALTQSGDDQDFPRLSEVPDTPRPASSPEDLNQIGEGLVADRDEARYTNETLRSRYAEDGAGEGERILTAELSAPERQPETTRSQAPEPVDLAEERRLVASEAPTAKSSSSLAEERRVTGLEPASEAVLGQRPATQLEDRQIISARETSSYSDSATESGLAESRRLEAGQTASQADTGAARELGETRIAAVTQPVAGSGVMSIGDFRALFNQRFDSSGRSPYRQGEMQRVAAQTGHDSLAADRSVAPGSSEILRAQMAPSTAESRTILADDSLAQPAVSFQVASIAFAVGSTALNSSDRTSLKRVVKLHKKFGGVVRVIGHSSKRTRDMESDSHRLVNFQLSLDRASAVAAELTRLGVASEAVMVMARSDNEPLTYEYMPEGEADNRRAEIYIEY
jgi:outer membrane protein OmpA-like peptidoglycan-associated protein